MTKISVIIPVYNVEKYLRECLDSVIHQTMKDIEIICVNDGSTDGSSDILNRYSMKDERFKIITQKNLGISVARNKGIESANGDYIAFIDSDDYLLNMDYYEKLYTACEKHNADIAVASIIRGNEKKSGYIYKVEEEKIATDYEKKLKICNIPESNFVWNKLYRRSKLLDSRIRFPEGYLYEDVFVTCKLLFCMDKLVSVPNVVYFYRKRRNSVIKNRSVKAKHDKLIAENEMYSFLKEKNISLKDLDGYTKKIKLFGITVFKTTIKKNIRKNTLLNCIKWQSVIM
jgi:glycosyltransferase involved in cell wall biosynthesis